MSRRRRREMEGIGLSFLDAIFCGFGAILLLFVIARGAEPQLVVRDAETLRAELRVLEEERAELDARINDMQAELDARQSEIASAERLVARYRDELTTIQGRHRAASDTASVQNRIRDQLALAQQQLSEEMKRLQAQRREAPPERLVGGIPVDSEYIIFIIDTSGSMQSLAWPLMRRKVEETLRLYPEVKGIQVMNDEGAFMFSQYAGKWIPDSPARRRAIVERLQDWRPFSNSSPVEGIEAAIRIYYQPDRRISLYVFGDEFTGTSIDDVVGRVDQLNRADAQGNRRVRIHGVGFPTMFAPPAQSSYTGVRFATLMRELARRNGGTFLGLNSAQQ
jgi:multidrug efflux pump subunit AcrA (membrane-fusion protein)